MEKWLEINQPIAWHKIERKQEFFILNFSLLPVNMFSRHRRTVPRLLLLCFRERCHELSKHVHQSNDEKWSIIVFLPWISSHTSDFNRQVSGRKWSDARLLASGSCDCLAACVLSCIQSTSELSGSIQETAIEVLQWSLQEDLTADLSRALAHNLWQCCGWPAQRLRGRTGKRSRLVREGGSRPPPGPTLCGAAAGLIRDSGRRAPANVHTWTDGGGGCGAISDSPATVWGVRRQALTGLLAAVTPRGTVLRLARNGGKRVSASPHGVAGHHHTVRSHSRTHPLKGRDGGLEGGE
jgi:hypothetical protein